MWAYEIKQTGTIPDGIVLEITRRYRRWGLTLWRQRYRAWAIGEDSADQFQCIGWDKNGPRVVKVLASWGDSLFSCPLTTGELLTGAGDWASPVIGKGAIHG